MADSDPLKPERHKKGEKIDQEATLKNWEAAWKNREKDMKEKSEKELRKQAKDFAAWLKEQKAI